MKKSILWGLPIAFLVLITIPVLALTNSESPQNQGLQGFVVAHIGRGNDLSTQVVGAMENLGAQVILSHDIPESVEPNERLIGVFDGEWIEEKTRDGKLHNFLRNTASKGAKLVAIGGATSKFFEALDEAGIVTETDVTRNPAYFDPPLVGFRMKEADGYTYPSILISNTNDVNGLVEGLIGWLYGVE